MEVDHARRTDGELDVLKRIGTVFAAFDALDEYHPSDRDEFVFHVHALSRIVMARSAMRAHPERGWIKTRGG